MNKYARFGAMISTSTLVMFGLMYLNVYLNTYAMSHVRFSETRAYMLFAGSLWLVRSQAAVDQVSWMKAMTPHHSIAILTSERVKITDPRVRKLADGMIEAQRREIAAMETLIKELD